MSPSLFLGATRPLDGRPQVGALHLPAHHLVTHGVVVGMTGSGKTGLVTVLVEEALRAGVPVLAIDVEGDLPNLLLAFPSFDAAHVRPWIEPRPGEPEGSADALAARLAEERQRGLEAYGLRGEDLSAFARASHVRVITPGAD